MHATLLRLRRNRADGEFEYRLAVPVLDGCERVLIMTKPVETEHTDLPGVMAYGATREEAITNAQAIAVETRQSPS